MRVGARIARTAGWIALAVAALLAAPAAHAQIYVYKDAYGRTFFTDAPPHDGYAPFRLTREVQKARAPGAPPAGALRPDMKSLDQAIQRASRQHGVSAALVKAVIAAESGFDPLALSRRGAQGLMQLMPQTAEQLGVDDAYDPWQNIDGGTRYLCEMIDRFPGELELALAAYNAGPDAVLQYQGVPPYAETRGYVKRVLAYYKKFHADFR